MGYKTMALRLSKSSAAEPKVNTFMAFEAFINRSSASPHSLKAASTNSPTHS